MSKRQKVWDVLYPLVFILLCMIVSTIAVLLAAALITVIAEKVSGGELETLPSDYAGLPLIINIVYFSATLLMQRQVFLRDSLRFGWEKKKAPLRELIPAAAGAVCLGDFLTFLINLSGLQDIFTVYRDTSSLAFTDQNPVLLIAATVILAPMAEELIFRGMIYRRARSYLGTGRAVLVSALLFGFYHMNIVQFLYAFVLGLFFAVVYEKTHSLAACVICHAAANLWSILRYQYLLADLPMRAQVILCAAEMFGFAACCFAGYRMTMREQ